MKAAAVAATTGSFLAVALLLYSPAFRGAFVSDDFLLIAWNEFVTQPDPGTLLALLDPYGEPRVRIVNYSPLLQLVHLLQWRAFGESVLGYHVTNVVLHAATSGLLVAFLQRSGLPQRAALALGALFLLHPANVEAVAWISQLKTPLSTALALGALLWLPSRPAAAFLCYVLAMLVKPTAFFALPVAAILIHVHRPARLAPHLRWLGGWALFTAVFLWVELAAFSFGVVGVDRVHPEFLVQVRSGIANVARYAAIALTSYGASTYHEPQAALSWFDPWWLSGLAVLAGVCSRLAFTFRRRETECVYWVWTLAAFGPVSQVFPFEYPMADRYLYTMLPGVLGGLAFALVPHVEPRLARAPARPVLQAAALALCAVFAIHSASRAALWTGPEPLNADAARHYPDGTLARLVGAARAAQAGDSARTAVELRGALRRGYRNYDLIQSDLNFDRVVDTPEVARVLREMAQWWIENLVPVERLTQGQLHQRARAHLFRREYTEAVRMYELALARGGPARAAIERELLYARSRTGHGTP
jgi:hypothetical protein